MITRLLVANRGEIARRVLRTCRDRGIATVAVYADPDARAIHAREADLAVRLPGAAAADTYLRGDLIVAAALAAGADAVHPGYGFLSENAAFAQAVLDAGLTWVGPSPAAIEAMGSKVAAKKLMAAAGVPVLPELDPAAITEADLPVLVKASAGGGGRGMRVVRTLAELPAQVEAARAEAAAAFGDPTVFCEPYLPAGRHIEVQVLADAYGTVWTLGERDCSIQRRHQKIVEEAPAPGLADAVRERLAEAAAAAARAIGYTGAGTVEFLAGPDGFHFLEMNTRLQVEHPVTEAVTGVDLVDLQLSVAEGAALDPVPPPVRGHAIEVRLYAEDPARDWRPQTGLLREFAVPGTAAQFAPVRGLRLDSGVTAGDTVGVHYDPMLAKLIAWAPSRAAAARTLAGAVAAARIHGLVTNRDLLVRLLRHPAFLAGDVDTSFLATHDLAELSRPLADERAVRLSAIAAALAAAHTERDRARVLGTLPLGWRNLGSAPQRRAYDGPYGREEVAYRPGRAGTTVDGEPGLTVGEVTADRVELLAGPLRHTFAVTAYDALTCVDSPLGPVALTPVDRFPQAAPATEPGSLVAPLPGSVIRVAAAEGDTVAAGQPLLWLEAMKMQHEITAPVDGVLTSLRVEVGRQVDVGAVLAVVTPAPAQEDQP
ncbi:acetyl/propionyl-CoA carboxylase subuit alpha [Catellatospora sp. TT07R-123]|uniref:ATP-binding protein n=1 Tax=Catellatospora sp. TT07R-123 TaxID=2733863 RepID=UPI001B18D50E|nr:biotin carboxylase N-terminal domain-containing protein [Catellatospora sp. TT07R-123]GHJ47769.1 acetyl/propionyl-CoA carboxylase subuit alpha [Catellatospora sp. TT07R-123]